MEEECRSLNEVFFKDVEQNKTFVALKTATTMDGKIAASSGDSKWITSSKSRDYSKILRKKYGAILTSSSTVIVDNPKMNHKLKVILDREFKTNFDYDIYKSGKIFLVLENKKFLKNESIPDNVEILYCKTRGKKFDLDDLMKILFEKGVKSVFVESGGVLSGSFVKGGYVDKIYQFIAPKILNDNSGRSCFDGDSVLKISECKKFKIVNLKKFGEDVLIEYKKCD